MFAIFSSYCSYKRGRESGSTGGSFSTSEVTVMGVVGATALGLGWGSRADRPIYGVRS